MKYKNFLLFIIPLLFFGFCFKKCYIYDKKREEKQLILKNKALNLCIKKTENRYVRYSVYNSFGDYWVCQGFFLSPDGFLEQRDLGRIQMFELEEKGEKQ